MVSLLAWISIIKSGHLSWRLFDNMLTMFIINFCTTSSNSIKCFDASFGLQFNESFDSSNFVIVSSCWYNHIVYVFLHRRIWSRVLTINDCKNAKRLLSHWVNLLNILKYKFPQKFINVSINPLTIFWANWSCSALASGCDRVHNLKRFSCNFYTLLA